MALQNYDLALADYTELIRLNPTAAVWYADRSKVYAQRKQWAAAIADLKQAISLADATEKSRWQKRLSELQASAAAESGAAPAEAEKKEQKKRSHAVAAGSGSGSGGAAEESADPPSKRLKAEGQKVLKSNGMCV